MQLRIGSRYVRAGLDGNNTGIYWIANVHGNNTQHPLQTINRIYERKESALCCMASRPDGRQMFEHINQDISDEGGLAIEHRLDTSEQLDRWVERRSGKDIAL